MRKLVYLLTLIAIVSCSKSNTYEFEPIKGVSLNVLVGAIKVTDEGTTLVKFKYKINNNSNSSIGLNTNNIKIIVNGQSSLLVHYNSLASNPEADFTIKEGNTEHNLYLMLESNIKNEKIKEFKVIDFGLYTKVKN